MSETKRVNLALQGGGSHGAFTWGVLDALIEDGRLEFEAVSGTSAGAMNAAILLQGWAAAARPARARRCAPSGPSSARCRSPARSSARRSTGCRATGTSTICRPRCGPT